MHLMIGLASAQVVGTALCVDEEARLAEPGCVELATLAVSDHLAEEELQALALLRTELEAVRLLLDVFDGELEIMSRLSTASGQVSVLRDEVDRELLYEALVLTGFAVHRYFQEQLAEDPAAEPYRVELAGRMVPVAWVEAAALDPDRDPPEGVFVDPGAAAAYDAVRAKVRLAPRALVSVDRLPAGAALVVDGREVRGPRAQLAPGTHRVAVVQGEVPLLHRKLTLGAGEELELELGLLRGDLEELAAQLDPELESVQLAPSVVALMADYPEPVLLVSGGDRWLVTGDRASPWEPPREASPLVLGVTVGVGWMYDGDWLLQNHAAGADAEPATVNSVTPVLGASLLVYPGALALGAGADVVLPTGPWHTLPSGETTLRMRAHPYLAVGLPQAQATVGYLFPWQLAVGARAALPVGPVEVGGALVYGVGLDQQREQGPDFEPSDVRSAWLTVGSRFGR